MQRVIDGAIIFGAAGFIAILALSAVFDPSIVWLHLFQALMYLGVIGLILRHSRWAYFLGLSIAGLWSYINLFVTRVFANGLSALTHLLATGQVTHGDQLIAVAAMAFHAQMVLGSIIQLAPPKAPGGDLLRLAAAFVTSTAYFIICIALLEPRYLHILSRVFQPHGL